MGNYAKNAKNGAGSAYFSRFSRNSTAFLKYFAYSSSCVMVFEILIEFLRAVEIQAVAEESLLLPFPVLNTAGFSAVLGFHHQFSQTVKFGMYCFVRELFPVFLVSRKEHLPKFRRGDLNRFRDLEFRKGDA